VHDHPVKLCRGPVAVNRRLTMTARLLLKRNYNTMNQAFLAIVVKILAPKFTIPTGFMD
jgi:hypothetical protein